MCSATLIQRGSSTCSGTQPTARFTARGLRVGSRPSTDTSPALGRSSAARTRSSVDLPALFAPSSPVTLPAGTRSARSSNTRVRP